jgi:predicted DNA-binding antitoxin AbrB/MazE fold protein
MFFLDIIVNVIYYKGVLKKVNAKINNINERLYDTYES